MARMLIDSSAFDQIEDVNLKKALIDVATFASSGKLPADEAKKFLDYVINESKLSTVAEVMQIAGETGRFNTLSIGDRICVRGVGGVDPLIRRAATPSKREVTPKEARGIWGIIDDAIEVNLEGNALRDHIMKMMAAAYSNNVEQLHILGDTVGPAATRDLILNDGDTTNVVLDDFMLSYDGLLSLAEKGGAATFDAEGEKLGMAVMMEAKHSVPQKYMTDTSRVRLLCPTQLDDQWASDVSGRVGPEGFSAMGGKAGRYPYSIEWAPLPLFPLTPTRVKHLTLVGTTPQSLGYTNIDASNVIVTPQTLTADTPVVPYIDTTDYVIDEANGTIASTGVITTVKVTFQASPMAILTPVSNLVIAYNRAVRMEMVREAYAQSTGFVISGKSGTQWRNLESIVIVKNLGYGE